MSTVGYAKAIYDFVSEYPEDVMLKAGDIVQVIQQVDDSWLKGKNRNKVGYFPITYIEPLALPSVDPGQKLFLTTKPFCGEVDGDLSFEVGHIVIGLIRVDENWWRGILNNEYGIFPLTHVVELFQLKNVWNPPVPVIKTSTGSPHIVDTRAIAVADLRAQLDDELSFVRGDAVTILHDLGDGFAIGKSGERIGQFPLSFVELQSVSDQAESAAAVNTVVDSAASATHKVSKAWKKSHTRQSSYTLLNTRSGDSSVAPYCSTLYPFAGNAASGELSFGASEIVHLISHVNEEWLYGKLDNRYGIFPASYVDIIVDCTTAEEGASPGCRKDETIATNAINSVVSQKKESVASVPAVSYKEDDSKFLQEIYGRVLYDFRPASDAVDEIDVTEGDTVTVLQKFGPNWLEVRHDDGRIGLCPTAYVELLGEEPSQSAVVNQHKSSPVKAVSKPKPPVKPKSVINSSIKPSTAPKPVVSPSLVEQLERVIASNVKTPVSPVKKSPTQWKPVSDNKPSLNELMGASVELKFPSSSAFSLNASPVASLSSTTIKPCIGAKIAEANIVNGHSTNSTVSSVCERTPPVKPAMPPRPPKHKLPDPAQRASNPDKPDLMQFSPDGELMPSQMSAPASIVDAPNENGLHQGARDRIIGELYQTEIDYCSCLELCVATFDDAANSPISLDDRVTLFYNINSVVALSQVLINRLKVDVIQKTSFEQSVGLCFLELKEEIQKIYAPYCRNHDTVIAILEKYEFQDHVMSYINQKLVVMRERMTVFDLSSLLIKPVQRILKYPLLLSELLKATEDGHPDKPNLVTAVAAMTEVAAAINEYKRRKDLVLKYKRETDAKFSDKIGRLSVHSTKKKFFRISQKMVGTQTVDERFNFEESRFKALESTVRIIIEDIALHVDHLEEALSCAEQMAGNVRDFYVEKSSEVDAFCSAHSTIVAKLFSNFKTQVDRDVVPPLSGLSLMFQGPSNVIRKRHDKLLDFDNASKRLGFVKENDQLNSTNDELITARANYLAINAQLLDDLPKLFTFAVEILFKVLCRLLQLQTAFHMQALESMRSCLESNTPLVGSDIVLNNLERFNAAHASIVDKISLLSLIPNTFNPRAEELRRAKPRLSSRDVFEITQQTEDQKTCLSKTYKPEQLFTVVQDFTGLQPYDLSLAKGSLVGVVKEVDPMGNHDRWFVDNGSTKGFVPSNYLSQQKIGPAENLDLLSWADPVPVASNQSPSVLDSSLWSQELFSVLDPPLLASSTSPSVASARSSVFSGSQTVPRLASTSSWEKFTDDVFSTPAVTVTHVSSAKDLDKLLCKDAPRVGVSNSCYRAVYSFSARDSTEVSLREGAAVTVLQRSDRDGNVDWWLVSDACGRTGYAPASYLEPASLVHR